MLSQCPAHQLPEAPPPPELPPPEEEDDELDPKEELELLDSRRVPPWLTLTSLGSNMTPKILRAFFERLRMRNKRACAR